MRIPLIAGNWKMYKTEEEAVALAESLKNVLKDTDPSKAEVAICPPFNSISAVHKVIKGSNIGLGCQNIYPKMEGAFTGEISPLMARESGCYFVILGHSERRQYFNETNEFINSKVKAVLEYKMTPILCVGEKLEDREAGTTEKVVENHIRGGFAGISKDDASKIVVAYEPVWAIGTGKTATKEQAQEVHAFIRKLLTQLYDKATADVIKIQYGGSVKPENAKELMSMPDIDGALVGGASLKADSFEGIVKYYR